MSPIHVLVWLFALVWQLVTAISLGGWLAGYGPTSTDYWAGRQPFMLLGLLLWGLALIGTIYHDEGLREIRRAVIRQKSITKEKSTPVDKLYRIPEGGLFRFILYPHYLCEWMEWAGFWMVAGVNCIPARSFVVNEVSTMLPRAIQGRGWYLETFGANKVGNKRAVIPGLL